MSHTLKLNTELGVIVLRAKQAMNVEDISRACLEMVQLPGFKKGQCLVADFRGSGTTLTADDIRQLASSLADRNDAAWGDTKWSIIAATDLLFGLSRMFVALTDQLQVDTRVFRDIEAANGWLGLPVDVESILMQTPDDEMIAARSRRATTGDT